MTLDNDLGEIIKQCSENIGAGSRPKLTYNLSLDPKNKGLVKRLLTLARDMCPDTKGLSPAIGEDCLRECLLTLLQTIVSTNANTKTKTHTSRTASFLTFNIVEKWQLERKCEDDRELQMRQAKEILEFELVLAKLNSMSSDMESLLKKKKMDELLAQLRSDDKFKTSLGSKHLHVRPG
jgi:hypothetical protein